MSPRKPDVVLADQFTKTTHTHPTPALDPTTNKLSSALNICIIGASRGIGAGIAYAYASACAPSSTLILCARSSSSQELAEVEKRVKELNASIRTICVAVDITSTSSVAELTHKIKEDVAHLDLLVLNSGYSGPVVLKVTEGNPQDFQDVFDVNVQGTYLIAHHLIPLLIASNGAKTFIVVGSFAACITRGHIANTAYCVSKFAQARLIEYISEQFGKEENGGLMTVGVHPGAVLTEMADKTTPDSFRSYLTDDVGLCGAFCVWLSHERRMWMNGRLVSATWDVDELLEKRDIIEDQDLLKFGFRTGDVSAA